MQFIAHFTWTETCWQFFFTECMSMSVFFPLSSWYSIYARAMCSPSCASRNFPRKPLTIRLLLFIVCASYGAPTITACSLSRIYRYLNIFCANIRAKTEATEAGQGGGRKYTVPSIKTTWASRWDGYHRSFNCDRVSSNHENFYHNHAPRANCVYSIHIRTESQYCVKQRAAQCT